ncbi:MAG: hypothetical protein OIN89_04230 [Candidatus Methanoperedens sp.]|nr:hypothetical protein [Candidatus Methanoperedens sp.]
MSKFKLLIVEDDEGDLETCRTTILRYEKEKEREIELVESKTLEDAQIKINNSFDGVIIDLKLGNTGDEGNIVIREIHDKYRFPVAILTGTPGNADPDFNNIINVYKKGEHGLDEILNYLIQIYDTGLTRIFGGRGHIENAMDKVFWNHIMPQLDSWISHVERGEETEQALLRFTINHLLEILNHNSDICYPEEMYISPVISDNIRTGSIVSDREKGKKYIVMSPACDLVCHSDGNFKTDRILLCEIEDFNIVKDIALKGYKKTEKMKDKVKELINDNYTAYYHWLPKTSVFEGGFINFRWTKALEKHDFDDNFNLPQVQVSSHFIKDVVSRFSSYYARQGQPDFNFKLLSSQLIKDHVGEE